MTKQEIRTKQKEFLRKYYFDYRPERHDAFVNRYKKEQHKIDEEQYQINREIYT